MLQDKHTINERAQDILRILIGRYIRDGQPVSSKSLVESLPISLSPATIRNIMAELEEKGYLQSPHTSAGRVPTGQGYRFFVDGLLTAQALGETELDILDGQLDPNINPQALVISASEMLSQMTHLVGVVSVPRREKLILKQIEFLPLSNKRVLIILVLNDHEVQNRVIHTDRVYSSSELQQAANYLTSEYSGKNIASIRYELLRAMRDDQVAVENMMQAVVEVVDKALRFDRDEDYVMKGEMNLLQMADEAGLDQLRSLFAALDQKRYILDLLDRCLQAEGVQIYIGEEAGYDVLDPCSLVTTTYRIDSQTIGVLGVIGPTRMDYKRVISMVDVTAKRLTSALNYRTLESV